MSQDPNYYDYILRMANTFPHRSTVPDLNLFTQPDYKKTLDIKANLVRELIRERERKNNYSKYLSGDTISQIINPDTTGPYGPLPIDMSGPAVKPPAGPGMPGGGPLEGGGDMSGASWSRGVGYMPMNPRLNISPHQIRQSTASLNQYGVPPSVPWYSPDVTSSGVGPTGPEMMPGASPGGGSSFYDALTSRENWSSDLTATEGYGMNVAASLIPTHDQTRVFEGGGSLPGIGKGATIGYTVGGPWGAAIGGALGLLGAFDTTSAPEQSVTTWQRGQSPGFPNQPTASYFQGLI